MTDRLIAIPGQSGKTSVTELSDLPEHDYSEIRDGSVALPAQAVRFRWDSPSFRHDLLWSPREDTSRLFVLFSGDAMRNRYEPPVFQRWTWARHFPGHCLYVSDPTLHLHDDYSLTWYGGHAAADPLVEIAQTVIQIAETRGVALQNVCFYGSSGGGFAAIRSLDLVPEASAVCINPQTDITAYERRTPLDKLLRHSFEGFDRETILTAFPGRFSILEGASERFTARHIIYVQNVLDTHHLAEHCQPFLSGLGLPMPDLDRTESVTTALSPHLHLITFSHEGGHKKAETPEAFSAAMSLLRAMPSK